VVPRSNASLVLNKSIERDQKEAATRQRLKAGELGLDIYSMRDKLKAKGLVYVDAAKDS